MIQPSRRGFLQGLGSSLGALALTDMLTKQGVAASSTPANNLRPIQTTQRPKAKAVIMLFMEGGPGQVDTFDPKPALSRLHGTESKRTKGLATSKRVYFSSPFKFRKVGNAGIEMCDRFVHMADAAVADELCIYRGCQAESLNHPAALLHMNTGSRHGGDPALGCWTTYGLGSINQNLPGYVVMTESALPQAGPTNWSNGFLPNNFQGTRLRSEGSPFLQFTPPGYRAGELALDEWVQQQAADQHPQQAELVAQLESHELAYRMQTASLGTVDLDDESEATREMYGLNARATETFGRLMARKFVEQGVRFVQIFSGGWDSHDYLARSHSARIAGVDKPIAALIKDLKQRGMLEDTLVVWTGEFGRTPDSNYCGRMSGLGRDHNVDAMIMWMAGGGTRRGAIVGATDEIGQQAVECVHPIRDLHVTLLHLLGLDDHQLTYFHDGRYKQLSQFSGQVIDELIA
jgi:methyl coenzyme M reductase subunit C